MISIEIIKSNNSWKSHKDINLRFVKAVFAKTLDFFPNYKNASQIEIAILLTDNAHMQSMNAKFLNKNYPTNVLSFPGREIRHHDALVIFIPDDYVYLGDIAFGYEIIAQESEDQGKDFHAHFTHLLIHGFLHLFGMDHVEPIDAKEMQKIEIAILQDFKIASPY